jgi:hypothetical protein
VLGKYQLEYEVTYLMLSNTQKRVGQVPCELIYLMLSNIQKRVRQVPCELIYLMLSNIQKRAGQVPTPMWTHYLMLGNIQKRVGQVPTRMWTHSQCNVGNQSPNTSVAIRRVCVHGYVSRPNVIRKVVKSNLWSSNHFLFLQWKGGPQGRSTTYNHFITHSHESSGYSNDAFSLFCSNTQTNSQYFHKYATSVSFKIPWTHRLFSSVSFVVWNTKVKYLRLNDIPISKDKAHLLASSTGDLGKIRFMLSLGKSELHS